MRRLVYLSEARRDLTQILRYIAHENGSTQTALRFTTAIRQQCATLASLPGTLGTPRPDLRPDIRSFACRGYVIFFRYEADRLEVVTIMEGHRDVERWFAARTD